MIHTIENRLYEFIDILRDASITISTDEILTLFNSLHFTDISKRTIFKNTLRTTLIKDYTDIPVFDTCFEGFFADVDSEADPHEMLQPSQDDKQKDGDVNLEQALEDFISELPESMLFEKSPEDILKLFFSDIQQQGESGGVGESLFPTTGAAPQQSFSKADDSDEERESLGNPELLRIAAAAMKRQKIGHEVKIREDYLLNKLIYQLTSEEIKEMRELIKRFGQKLKNRISLRKKKMKHGGIDIKHTIRTSLQYGGIPFKIFYKNRKIDRPQLVVLCDVSGSVNQYTRFMLLLTHTLQSLFSKVRTFAFISRLVEITPLFMEMDPERAINSIFNDTNFTYGWGSNYGNSLIEFIENHSDSLNSKTTVLVLGDARNNSNDSGIDAFQAISEKARNVFWLNPEKKHLWDWSDSIASLYIPFCEDMKEVNNFMDLTEFIDKLFLD